MWHSMSEGKHMTEARTLLRSGAIAFAAALLAGCALFDKATHAQRGGSGREYVQVITVLKPIEGVPVTVSYQGNAVYRVLVGNTLPGVVNLMWDQSAYVTTRGESVRLLHLPRAGKSLREAPAQQAESPVAPGAQLEADFTGETWLESNRSGAPPQPKDSSKKARLFLSFSIKGKRVAWRGEIAFLPPSKQ
jgi:hypothetical protein